MPLFEALVTAMVEEMPVAAVAALSGESDMRIWRVVHHDVDQAVEAQDLLDELQPLETVRACGYSLRFDDFYELTSREC